MAVAFRASASQAAGTRNNPTVTKPSGTVADDILIWAVLQDTGAIAAVTPPSGFALIHSTPNGAGYQLDSYWKRAGGSEGASYAGSLASSEWCSAFCAAFSGALTSGDPQDATATENTGTSAATITALGLTTATANAMLVYIGAQINASAGNWTPPSGMAERADLAYFGIATLVQAGAGATGNKSGATSEASGIYSAQLIALREAAGAATKAPPPFLPLFNHLLGR